MVTRHRFNVWPVLDYENPVLDFRNIVIISGRKSEKICLRNLHVLVVYSNFAAFDSQLLALCIVQPHQLGGFSDHQTV